MAGALLELADQSLTHESFDGHLGFWREILDRVPDFAKPEQAVQQLSVMHDDQAKEFERTSIAFGQHKGLPHSLVPITYLTWLVEIRPRSRVRRCSSRKIARIVKPTVAFQRNW